ncbi:uncharacterized protein [Euphorbia lathyris]|uniref:uncharacterized protein n=1 Tax=Euphorbia lathyris TaxID=212925 RepID=UPI00331375A4
MIPWICKTLISSSSNTSNRLRKYPIFQSIYLVSFSTSESKSNVTTFDYLVNKQHFSPKSASNVSSLPSFEYLKKPQNADSVLNFLKESGFSKHQIEYVVKKLPQILSANLEKSIKPKFKVFQDLDFDSSDVAEIICRDPRALTRSVDNRIAPSILVLKSVLGSNADVCRLLKTRVGLLSNDLKRKMLPNVEYLKSCGMEPLQITKYVFSFSRLFLIKPESMKLLVKRVDEMGVDRTSKKFLCAVRVMSSMSKENWDLKLKLFSELGFSEEHILFMFRRAPQAFAVSERKIKEVTKLLLSVKNLDISYIASNPDLLTYSVEKKLKPRLEVLKVLESKKLLKKKYSLYSFCKMTDAQFAQKYVIPYSKEGEDSNVQ